MTRYLGALVLGAGLAGLWACDDEPVDPCANLADACDVEGTRRCTVEHDAILACQANDEGCLLWVEIEACEASCDDDGEEPLCVEPCSDECTLDESRCQGEVIQTCEAQATGCTSWVDGADCAATSQSCDASGDAAVCVDA